MRRRLAAAVATTTLTLTAGIVAVATLGPSAPAGAAEDYPAPADGVFTVTGHGYGHGIGLSQYGARAAATQGLTGGQILDFYYPGTATATDAAGSSIRVRLMAASTAAVPVQGGAGLAVRDAATGQSTPLPAAAARYRIVADAAALRVQSSTDAGVTWSPVTLSGGAAGASGPLVFEAAGAIRLYYPDGTSRDYEGTVAGVRAGTATLYTVNTLGLDAYVNGVLGREMPSYWPAAALRAQAVAARTYAGFARASRPSSALWDICDTTQCQVYGGRRLYSGATVTDLQPTSVRDAVAATARQLRTYAGAPIFAQFSASNGGYSVADTRFPYLVAKPDPYDPVNNPYATWTATLSVARLAQCFPAAGTVQRLSILTRDGHGQWGGRILTARLYGRTAAGAAVQQDVTGSALRSCGSATGFRTTYATVTSTWRSTGSPAAVRRTDETLEVFARGPQGDLYHRSYRPTGGWRPWESLGGVIVGAPTAQRQPSGAIVVWARSTSNQLATGSWQNGAWSGWRTNGGSLSSRPYPVALADGRRFVFARGGDGQVTYASWAADGTWLGWRTLPAGVLAGAGPAAVATGRSTLTVAVVGINRTVYLRSLSGSTWSAWRSIGDATTSDVTLAVPSAGVLDVYLRAADGTNALHTRRSVNGVWAAWQNLGG
ncbi:MAG TPA: SpoIID/LytB domain-containing protein, partial [Mycobacteriales bacterium]|nr:SpoIID/LytB domain-containing protein [Mycobacteriales bacterium]